nr:immunoglobulin light chain junction region [Macaca mulatta]MOV37519.1 immunoglobulin light chain junction region [Macaca mulatta]
CQHSYGTLWTF